MATGTGVAAFLSDFNPMDFAKGYMEGTKFDTEQRAAEENIKSTNLRNRAGEAAFGEWQSPDYTTTRGLINKQAGTQARLGDLLGNVDLEAGQQNRETLLGSRVQQLKNQYTALQNRGVDLEKLQPLQQQIQQAQLEAQNANTGAYGRRVGAEAETGAVTAEQQRAQQQSAVLYQQSLSTLPQGADPDTAFDIAAQNTQDPAVRAQLASMKSAQVRANIVRAAQANQPDEVRKQIQKAVPGTDVVNQIVDGIPAMVIKRPGQEAEVVPLSNFRDWAVERYGTEAERAQNRTLAGRLDVAGVSHPPRAVTSGPAGVVGSLIGKPSGNLTPAINPGVVPGNAGRSALGSTPGAPTATAAPPATAATPALLKQTAIEESTKEMESLGFSAPPEMTLAERIKMLGAANDQLAQTADRLMGQGAHLTDPTMQTLGKLMEQINKTQEKLFKAEIRSRPQQSLADRRRERLGEAATVQPYGARPSAGTSPQTQTSTFGIRG